MYTPTRTQTSMIGFVKEHGFHAIANIDGEKIAIFIPSYHVETGERDIAMLEAHDFASLREALGY